MVLPLFSGRFASWMAAHTAAPEEMPYQNALLLANQLAGGKGILVFHRNDLIIDLCVQHIRNEPCADALDLMAAGRTLTQHRRGRRLHGHHLYIGILALEVFANTGNCTAGAHTCHKDVHLAVGILPNFGACGGLVDKQDWQDSQTARE